MIKRLHQTCRGVHNVFEENLRLAKWSPVIYKGIIMFGTGSRGRLPLQCLIVVLKFVCRGGVSPPVYFEAI